MSSTTFDAQLDVAGIVAEESPELYFEIQALNDYGAESLHALGSAVERLRTTVLTRDFAAFRGLMEQGLSYLNGRREQVARRALVQFARSNPVAVTHRLDAGDRRR